jgi:hypothetical protein
MSSSSSSPSLPVFSSYLPTPSSSSSSSFFSFLSMSWQTGLILILILALLGINIFAYLAKGTQDVAVLIDRIAGPLLKLIGYGTLTTTKQTVEATATGATAVTTGATAGINLVANATTNTIDKLEQNMGVPKGQSASSSLPAQQQQQQPQQGGSSDIWQPDALERVLHNASQSSTEQVSPDDSRSSIQTTGKSGWCYIGEEQGIRACSEVGVNDTCMSGNIFPSQEICMNPNLRA